MKRLERGEVLEIKTPMGFAYCQYIQKVPPFGLMFRLFRGLQEKSIDGSTESVRALVHLKWGFVLYNASFEIATRRGSYPIADPSLPSGVFYGSESAGFKPHVSPESVPLKFSQAEVKRLFDAPEETLHELNVAVVWIGDFYFLCEEIDPSCGLEPPPGDMQSDEVVAEWLPCRFVDSEGDERVVSVVFDNFEHEAFEAISRRGIEVNGYYWEAVVKSLVQRKHPRIIKKLHFDSEGSMTVVISSSKQSLKKVVECMRLLLTDRSILESVADSVDPSEY